jgi:hypothetical protein
MTVFISRISGAAALLIFTLIMVLAQESARGMFLKSRPTVKHGPQSSHSSATVALGYSLFLRDASKKAVRVKTSRVFKPGDAIRILLESNSDGHLYIFNQEGNSPLRMIYPDLLIRGGATRIMAHVPLLLPSEWRRSAGDGDWFVLSGPLQRELLYVVFSHQLISPWPAGKRLLAFPVGFTLEWDEFRKIARSVTTNVDNQASQDEGAPMTIGEQTSLSRGLKLVRQDPGPSVVRINENKLDPFVIEIELLRK